MTKRSLRWSEQVCVLEGPDLVEAALNAGAEFEGIYVAESAVGRFEPLLSKAHDAGVRIFSLAEGVIEKVADATTPQPLLAAVRMNTAPLESIRPRGTVIVLHEVRDPGNVGTIIRSADASGASAVIITGQSVDPYNPKTLRATAGSMFHVPVVVEESLQVALDWFHAGGGQSYATVVRGGHSLDDLELGENHLFIVGNEADGLSDDDAARAGEALTIPMSGRAESLNVSIAAALVLFAGQRARHRAR